MLKRKTKSFGTNKSDSSNFCGFEPKFALYNQSHKFSAKIGINSYFLTRALRILDTDAGTKLARIEDLPVDYGHMLELAAQLSAADISN